MLPGNDGEFALAPLAKTVKPDDTDATELLDSITTLVNKLHQIDRYKGIAKGIRNYLQLAHEFDARSMRFPRKEVPELKDSNTKSKYGVLDKPSLLIRKHDVTYDEIPKISKKRKLEVDDDVDPSSSDVKKGKRGQSSVKPAIKKKVSSKNTKLKDSELVDLDEYFVPEPNEKPLCYYMSYPIYKKPYEDLISEQRMLNSWVADGFYNHIRSSAFVRSSKFQIMMTDFTDKFFDEHNPHTAVSLVKALDWTKECIILPRING